MTKLFAKLSVVTVLVLTGCQKDPSSNDWYIDAGKLPSAADQADLLFVGSFHFKDAGLDSFKPKDIDIFTDERQGEIEALVAKLATFKPTKIGIERKHSTIAKTDSLYQAYLAGNYELGANEIYQIAFRLGKMMGHDQLYPIDAPARGYNDLPSAADYAKANDQEHLLDDPLMDSFFATYAFGDSLKATMSIGNFLLHINSEARLSLGHGHYLTGSAKLGKGDDAFGGDDWIWRYSRNLRVFNKIQRITESSNDRILVLIGAGHVPLLRFLAEASAEHNLVELYEVLD